MSKHKTKVDPATARRIYLQLGALSNTEMIRMRAMDKDYARRSYLHTIYGRYAGQVAWMEYLKWLRRQERKGKDTNGSPAGHSSIVRAPVHRRNG